MSAAQNIVDFVRGFGERRRDAGVRSAMGNYLTDPNAAIQAVNNIDPYAAMELNRRRTQDQTAQTAAQAAGQERQAASFQRVTSYLRGLPQGADYGAALDGLSPFLKGSLGATDQDIAGWRQAITSNPDIINALDDNVSEARAQAQFGVKTLTPGSALYIGGEKVGEQPFAPQYRSVRRGDGGYDVVRLDPNEELGSGMVPGIGDTLSPPSGGAGGPMTVEGLRSHFVAQESGGNYGARNAETGALGAYQVMPATGQTLARRLGLAWRPDMMTQETPTARRYQDAIGGAAIQEAIEASGGDPATAFSYYHGGSNRAGWGPRTRQYSQEMMTRFGGGQPSRSDAPGAGAVYSTAGGAPAGRQVRNATAEEIAAAGYAPGTAAQIDANGRFVNMRTPTAGRSGANGLTTAQVRQQEAFANAQRRVQGSLDGLSEFEEAANAILNNPNLDSYVGNVQGRLPGFLSGGRNDFNMSLEALKTKVGLTSLQNMRDMSATGGALGQVSNYENRMLQQSIANLDASQSEGQFRRNLQIVIRNAQRARNRLTSALARTPGAPQQAPAGAPAVGTIARNPQTGARVRFNGQGWEPVR